MVSYSNTTKIPRDLFNLIFIGKSFQKHKVMLFDYKELDVVGKNLSVKKPSELRSDPGTIVFKYHLMI